MPLGPLKPVSLADRAYDELLAALLSGALEPDRPLVQDVLAAQLGISRTPLREALMRMERQGLVRATGRSFVVPELQPGDVDELYGVREAVEPYAAQLLVQRGPRAVERVAAALAELASRSFDTGSAAYEVNRLAHRSVVEACGNRILLEVFDDLWSRGVALRSWADYYTSASVAVDVEADHADLLVALRSGSPERAREAMAEHIRAGLRRHPPHTAEAQRG